MNQIELLVSPIQYYQSKHCGYCNLEDKEESPDLLKSCLICTNIYRSTTKIYEALMNKGFRRSGSFLYGYDYLRNCCQLFTIRTRFNPDPSESTFKITKEMKRRINKFANVIGSSLDNPKNKFDFMNSIRNLQRNGSGKFTTRFEPAKFSNEKFDLYKIYQMKVHDEEESEIKENSFKKFLCTDIYSDTYNVNLLNSLNNWYDYDTKEISEIATTLLGAFHELYYLNDQLVAISVIDILPHSISSVYFIWHPDYANLGLGTVSALRDIAFTYHIGKEHYYLGYLSMKCPKMAYKQKFGGELLDLTNNKFASLDHLIQSGSIKDDGPIVLKEIDQDLTEHELKNLTNMYKSFPDKTFNVQNQLQYAPTWHIQKNKRLINIAKELYSFNEIKNGRSIYDPLPTFFIKPDAVSNHSKMLCDGFPEIVIGSISKKQLYQEILGPDFDVCNITLLNLKFPGLQAVSYGKHDEIYENAEAIARFFGPAISKETFVILM